MDLIKGKIINGFLFSTGKSKLDLNYIHIFLSTQSYWAQSISKSIVARSISHSLSVGVYKEEKQIGFAGIITEIMQRTVT